MKNIVRNLLTFALNELEQMQIVANNAADKIQIQDPKSKEHGDCASNIALLLAKEAKMPPRKLADLICSKIPQNEAISKFEIAGAGFINFYQNHNFLVQKISAALLDAKCGVIAKNKQIVVIDISSPNLAKEMHVGHLRSTIIGDCQSRVLEFLGDKVIRQNHVGDWGTQFGMLLAYLAQNKIDVSNEVKDLEQFYRAAKKEFDASPAFADLARQMVVKLQAGDEKCLNLWRKFNSISLQHCQQIYDLLQVKLSLADVKGESSYNNDLPKVIADLTAKNMLTISNGAACVFMPQFTNSEGQILPLIVQKESGGYLYATTDLAALRYRTNILQANRILYFVDMRQSLHFQMVFACARKAQFVADDVSLEFMGFGTLNDADGKPFKTRDGGTVRLLDLLQEAQKRAFNLVQEKNPELDEQTLQKIADAVAIGAVKYADLAKNRTSDYNFSFTQMLKFDGNTAPYLMYAYARIVSLLGKANLNLTTKLNYAVQLEFEHELDLANKLMQFNEVVHKVAQKGTPHLLCAYLYDLAGLFSSFYEHCPILAADNEDLKNSRLQLAILSGRILKQGLNLLGVPVLERM